MLRPRLSISATRPYTAGPHRTLYIHDLTGCYQIYKSFTRVVITHVHRLLVLLAAYNSTAHVHTCIACV